MQRDKEQKAEKRLLFGIADSALSDGECGLVLGHFGTVVDLGDAVLAASLAEHYARRGRMCQNVPADWLLRIRLETKTSSIHH